MLLCATYFPTGGQRVANKDFVEFMSTYLPQHPDLQKRIEGITDPREFVTTAISEGTRAGFSFNDVDVDTVMHASVAQNTELSDEQLESVAGGATMLQSSATMVQISNLSSFSATTSLYAAGDTMMCRW
jgi:hypothetical protein